MEINMFQSTFDIVIGGTVINYGEVGGHEDGHNFVASIPLPKNNDLSLISWGHSKAANTERGEYRKLLCTAMI